jgi:hypothetical protein
MNKSTGICDCKSAVLHAAQANRQLTERGGGGSDLSRPVRGGTFPPQNHRIPPQSFQRAEKFPRARHGVPPTIPISPPQT